MFGRSRRRGTSSRQRAPLARTSTQSALSPPPLTSARLGHAEALETVRELANGLDVDGWFTCNHTHYARVASFRKRHEHGLAGLDDS